MEEDFEARLAEFMKSLDIRISFLEDSLERIVKILNSITQTDTSSSEVMEIDTND